MCRFRLAALVRCSQSCENHSRYTGMAAVALIGFRDDSGDVPFLDWLESLPEKAQGKCRVRLTRLRDMGNELRRPEADYLRDGVYELRFKYQRINYRVLYFFH